MYIAHIQGYNNKHTSLEASITHVKLNYSNIFIQTLWYAKNLWDIFALWVHLWPVQLTGPDLNVIFDLAVNYEKQISDVVKGSLFLSFSTS